MSKVVVVEVYGMPVEVKGAYGVVKSKRFPDTAERDIARFIKKWTKKIDGLHQPYDIEKFTVDDDEEPEEIPIITRDFIMNRFMKVL